MSKGIWIISGIGLILFAGILWYFIGGEESVKNFPSTKNGPVMIFGDSLAEGVGASPRHDLASLLSRKVGAPVLNYGVAGDTTAMGLARLTSALEEDPKLVLIILGGNDFLKKVPRTETFSNLEKIVKAFQAQGAMVMVIGVRSGIIGGGADGEYEALAEKTKSAYFEDLLSGIFGHTDLMSDAIHPNDAGYAKIGERLIPKVQELLESR